MPNETLTLSPLTPEQLRLVDAYWRAANYLTVGEIFLRGNPLLREPLKREHVKPRMLGHWGTSPGINFIYAHLNRLIAATDLNAIFIAGPGHGGPAVVANAYLEGTYSEVYPTVGRDTAGLKRLFTQFAWPGGVGSHAAPETPGSIHEGGELGYSLAHAFGAVLDNPDLLAVCVVGDGEAETGPLAASWHSNKFLNPARDGAVLPILHLNGYKIANPTVLSRIPEADLAALMRGCGYEPRFVSGDDPALMHSKMAEALNACAASIEDIQRAARTGSGTKPPRWPMIALRTPKGWTGPKFIDDDPVEGTCRAHSFRMNDMETPGRVELLSDWLSSYRPEELFAVGGRLVEELCDFAPKGIRRMSANPHANGGLLLKELTLPDFRSYELAVPRRGGVEAQATHVQGRFIRDVLRANGNRFRVFSPDETISNGWSAVYETDQNCFMAEIKPLDLNVSPSGRVMEVLSEHLCEGWLEGYLLTGRHGFLNCYEGFIQIVASMQHQHAKWLDLAGKLPWRRPIASLNILLSSHVWRQDHNGFSHLAPGILDHLCNMKGELTAAFLPPDANTLLCVTDACLRSRSRINVVVGGKQMGPHWLSMDEAVEHCGKGVGVWDWASSCGGEDPDIVMACCGDVPTMETLAAVMILRSHAPALKIRVVNVVSLMRFRPRRRHPFGLTDSEFEKIFPLETPVIFAFHGYPSLADQLVHHRPNGRRFSTHGFMEEGTASTPFDTVVLNQMSRWHLALDALTRTPGMSVPASRFRRTIVSKLAEHRRFIAENGMDLPEIRQWRWVDSPRTLETRPRALSG